MPTGTSGGPHSQTHLIHLCPKLNSEHNPQSTTGHEPDLRGNKPRPGDKQDEPQGTQFSVGVLGTHGSLVGPGGGVHPTAKLLV